jgi:hypothetical protein
MEPLQFSQGHEVQAYQKDLLKQKSIKEIKSPTSQC